jgi:hypothetical protein
MSFIRKDRIMEKALLKRLESLRDEMNQLALVKGLSNHQVLLLSQEIDEIHNKLNELKTYRNAERINHNKVKERPSIHYAAYQQTTFAFALDWYKWKRHYLKIGATL